MPLSLKFLVVTGCLLISVAAETFAQPLNSSVIFSRERDIMFSNNVWRIVIDVKMEPYEEALSIIRGDLLRVEEREQEFTFNSELKSTGTLLTTLETKLHTFKQILPKLDPRRGLTNFGGAMLKTLFGTAVDSDITSLHNNFDELQSKQQDIVHSVANQLTYIKKLDTVTSVNADAYCKLIWYYQGLHD